ncbi:hypothetical protein TIFTF001_013925 [Ficus carica]|uniref:DUF8039 domain-containing protein n=1 Tax=Ficus carica TaxID=3494 RepID=A0AA88A4C9_FICCA|nr:hypothetical protein TIFTF001_013925 [Ficus carica]
MEHSKKGRARRKNPLDPNVDGKRRATIMKRVHMARKRGERIQVTFDEKGQPEGKHGDKLMSWIGVLAREHFKKTGKWERRDGLWLEQQTGTDGELKDPACKKVNELITEYNTQESQGTFESVGTSDVLSQALSRPEHKGRVRGQSKFMWSRRLIPTMCQPWTNTTALRLVALPKKKQHGVSDPPTLPVDSQECKLYIFDEVQGGQLLVAFGRAWLESLPTDTVHGIPLGEENVRVSINVSKLKKSPLPIPTYEATTVEDAINGFVAWPKRLVEIEKSMNKASRGPSHIPDRAAGRKKNAKKSLEIKQSTLRLRINGQVEKFAFVSPTLISPVRTDTEDAGMRDRADNLISFLRDAPKGRLYLVPHNRGRHWVLGVIDPWEDLVFYFDPLREKKRDDFTELMDM